MKLDLTTSALQDIPADYLVLPVLESAAADTVPASDAWLNELNTALDGSLARLRASADLTGKQGECCTLLDTSRVAADRIVCVGLGKPEDLTLARWQRSLAVALRTIATKTGRQPVVALPPGLEFATSVLIEQAVIAGVVAGVGQGVYLREAQRHPLVGMTIVAADEPAHRKALGVGHILGDAINLTRDLVNRCADEIYPESVAERVSELAGKLQLECTVLDEPALVAEKMGSLLAVAKGSDRPPRVVELRYRGGSESDPVLALVGKGVCFDSGGLSLKTSEGMKTMKADMAGAATVVGAMSAIAKLQPKCNVTGYLGLVENMVSGSSYKLGDVLTARNGVTIEVLNTDAEGRLVLADVLDYAVSRGATQIIDLATLTGACVVALGEDVTGLFSNNDDLTARVQQAAAAVSEEVWPLPMFDHYAELLKSDVADCKNIGTRWGGAITAAKFLEKFVSETPWVHLDIAGPSFASSEKPHRDGGATGAMLQTLVQLVRQ